jgi:hypothetical protein
MCFFRFIMVFCAFTEIFASTDTIVKIVPGDTTIVGDSIKEIILADSIIYVDRGNGLRGAEYATIQIDIKSSDTEYSCFEYDSNFICFVSAAFVGNMWGDTFPVNKDLNPLITYHELKDTIKNNVRYYWKILWNESTYCSKTYSFMIDTVPPSRVRALSKSMDRSIAPAFYRTPYYVDLYGRHTAQPKANSIQLDIANDRVRFFINK